LAQIFPPWWNKLPIVAAIAGVLGPTLAIAGVWYYFSPWYTDVGYRPVQPVPYSHRLHVGELGLDCRYCHASVETSAVANVPPTQTCMNCHHVVKKDSDALAPIRDSAASGRPIGSSRYLTLRPEHRGLEIGWTWLEPSAWGTGANVEAKLLMLSHAFDVWGCRRVELKTDALNDRSRGAIEALGAKKDGVIRHHHPRRDGTVRDTVIYSILAAEWPDVKRHLELRLARHGG